ncbi:hypothetical protein HXY33_00460 [Candidatus Bathyarchaeota archaeon]|nr:hypothetical protein [Candidatus Bathyarchaeota archaeon]
MEHVSPTVEEHIAKLEKGLMSGRGRWIADFNESHRNFRLGDVEFDLLIEGNTRMKGFLLSRLFSFLLNPNYPVSCFVLSTKSLQKLDQNFLKKVLALIRSYMKKKEVKWSWLFIFSSERTRSLKSAVEKIDDQTFGVVLIDVDSKEMFHSDSYLGKQAKRFVKV